MAKRKSRAARKEQRVRVSRAEAHGLPAPELPQPVKKAPRDATVRDEYARKSPAAAGARAERVAAANQSSGLPTIYKVLIGAAAAIGLIFGLSQLRKSDPAAMQESANQEAPSAADVSTSGLAEPVSDEAPVAVIEAASDLEHAASAQDISSDSNLTDAVQEVRGASESSAAQDETASSATTPNIVAPAAGFAAPAKTKAAVTASPSPAIEAQAAAPKIVAPSEPRAPSVEKPVVVGPTSPPATKPPAVTKSPTVAVPATPQAPTTPQAPKTPTAPPTPAANESE